MRGMEMEIFLIILACLLVIIIIPFLIFEDLILILWYFLTPKLLRNKCINQFKKSEQNLTILGTLHGMHLTSDKLKKYYSYLDIKAVINNIKPDLLLVESLQSEINLGNIGDGPPEMLYAHLIARELNIPVKGIDWYSLDGTPGRTSNKRDEEITKNIIDSLNGFQNILVIVGASHLLVDRKKIKKYGYKRKHIAKKEINKIFFHEERKLIFPKEMQHYIDIRIEREKEKLKTIQMDEKWKQATNNVIRGLEKYKEIISEDNTF